MAFLRKLITRPGRTKSSTFTGYRPVGVAAPLVEADSSLEARISAYGRNELVFTCVDIRATSAADARLMVQERDAEGNWVEAPGHPMRRLIMRPNAKMDEAAFIRAAIASYDVANVFYCEIVRAAAGNPVELHPLDPTKVRPVYRDEKDGSRTLTGYEWKDGRYKKTIPVEDMLVRAGNDVLLDQARLGRAMGSVDLDNLQTDFTRAFFKNGGIPSGILKYHRRLTDEQKDLIRLQWRARYNMPWGNPQDVAVLDDEQEYQRVGVGLNELESAILRAVSETRIAMVFKVSPLIIYAYIGIEKATYSNLQESWKQFWQSTMSPLLRDWRAWLQMNLLTEFHDEDRILDEQLRLWWDLSAVAALREDVDALHTRARESFRAGGITLDEFRAAIGFDPYPDPALGETNPYLLELLARAKALSEPRLPAGEEDDEEAEAEAASHLPRLETLAAAHGRLGRLARGALATGRATPPPHPTPEEIRARNKAQREDEAIYLDAYGADVRELVEKALAGRIEREAFVAELRALSTDWLVLLFLVGALFPHTALTAEEEAALVEPLVAARESAATFGDDLYTGRYGGVHGDGTADPEERVGLWVAAGATVLTLGRTFRADDLALMWVRGGTGESCSDCLAHHGMVMRASEWRRYPLRPKSQALECSGFRCGCDLYEVEGGE
jgi:HK97 family phage portal protein